jgi:hypothetical protein
VASEACGLDDGEGEHAMLRICGLRCDGFSLPVQSFYFFSFFFFFFFYFFVYTLFSLFKSLFAFQAYSTSGA